MAEAVAADAVFVYLGGDQVVPRNVRYVCVHKSVKIITAGAFQECTNLAWIEMHDGVEIIEEGACYNCRSLRSIKLTGVRVIGDMAFRFSGLEIIKFGDKLEIIGEDAFLGSSLRHIKIPKVREIKYFAFSECEQLTDAELSADLERVGGGVFSYCPNLRRVALPLKDYLFQNDHDPGVEDVFYELDFNDDGDFISSRGGCPELSRVDLVGGIHKTISSLHLESWRNEMTQEIDRIHRLLPNTQIIEKTTTIQRWIDTVLRRIEHYKLEPLFVVREGHGTA